MWMMKPSQDLDFAVEVVLELLIELAKIDRLDCDESSGSLKGTELAATISQTCWFKTRSVCLHSTDGYNSS